jgi:hypothetical protein
MVLLLVPMPAPPAEPSISFAPCHERHSAALILMRQGWQADGKKTELLI